MSPLVAYISHVMLLDIGFRKMLPVVFCPSQVMFLQMNQFEDSFVFPLLILFSFFSICLMHFLLFEAHLP